MSEPFRTTFQVPWSALDPNNHVANSAYLDFATQTRFLFLASQGFTPADFAKAGIGPAIHHEEQSYLRELRFLETVSSELWMRGYAENGSQFRLFSRFVKADGTLAATVTATARWFDLRSRKVTIPPPELHAAMSGLARTPDFEVLPSGLR